MKKTIVAGFALAFTIVPTFAQSLTSGLPTTELFRTDLGQSITGVEVEGTSLYYLLQRGAASTQLLRRSALDGYATPTVLFDYGTSAYGSFVKEFGGKLYFGESSANTLRTFDLGTSAVSTLGTVEKAYDIDFSGGFGWVSATPGYAGNQIMKLDLTTGVTTTVLTSSDFSGPLVFGGTSLFYGRASAPAGLYRYTAAELNAGGLSLDAGHLYEANSGNAYFESLEGQPGFFARSDFAQITVQDFMTPGTGSTIATSTNTIGNMASDSEGLFVAVTNYSLLDRSAIFRVVPEPGTASLLGLAVALLGTRRRKG